MMIREEGQEEAPEVMMTTQLKKVMRADANNAM